MSGTGYALEFVEQLPGVRVDDESEPRDLVATTRVYWMKDLDSVRDAVADRIRALEIEQARE
ncbi:MAG: hypothetical protein AB7N70_01345 [Dehalococcoidia bacterium]